jgi:hypothetical protein
MKEGEDTAPKAKSVGKRLLLCLGAFAAAMVGCIVIGLILLALGAEKVATMVAASALLVSIASAVTTWVETSPKKQSRDPRSRL